MKTAKSMTENRQIPRGVFRKPLSLDAARGYDHSADHATTHKDTPRAPPADSVFMSYPLLTFFTLSAPMRFSPCFPHASPRLSPRVAALVTAFFLASGPHVSHLLVGVSHGLL